MSPARKLHIRASRESILKIAGVVSNSVMLAANAYLLGTGIQNNLRLKKQQRITDNLQTTAELANAVAGLTKVITDTIGNSHETG